MCADLPDYKNTLNLPKTDFPMRAGLPLREPGWLERWERIGIYGKLREKKDRKIFALHDGPPYANGHLHIGHALNKIIKDMIVRSHQMMGFDSRYVPGWDCHGLPIEWKIEERYRAKGKNKDDLDIVSFRQECRGFAEGWVNVQREEFKRLGVTGAWDDPYLTMAFHAERVIAEEFMKFLMNGTLYQGSKPVMWSPVEKTALAEAEVEYHDRETDAIWVKFPVVRMKAPHVPTAAAKAGRVDEARTSHEVTAEPLPANTAVVIWTTTPWTIPQNRAICFGPEISYGLYEITGRPTECWVTIGDRYILADDLVENVFAHARLDPAMYRRVRDVTSGELESLICGHPLRGAEGANGEWDHDVPLLPGGHVTDAVGTGFVHTAPSHGDDDYQIGLRHGLKMTFNILDDSSFRADLPFFAGKAILKPDGKPGGANGAVMDKLVEIGAMLARQRITISDAYSWRSKAPVIRLNRPQWFVDIDKDVGDGLDRFGRTIRQRALTEIDNVEWTPRSGRNRLHAMMEVRPDWVLSRQRAWGVPLACFTKKNAAPGGADFLLRDPAVNARILEAFESEGADTWYRDGAKERFLSR
ncbi:MAG: class I tRNA ligase family protein, partial [Pseudomonadota bacterium]